MLKNIIITISLLSGYMVLLILLKWYGLTDHTNLLLSSGLVSLALLKLVSQRIFFYVSTSAICSLLLMLGETELLMFTLTGIVIGKVTAHSIRIAMRAQTNEKSVALAKTRSIKLF